MTSLQTAVDRYLGRSSMVVPALPTGPTLVGRDDAGYGQTVTWWWADERRLVLPVDTGVLVATDPAEVERRPLRLRGCARLLLVDAGAGGTHEVREAHDATIELTRTGGHGLLAPARDPDPGQVPAAVEALVGDTVHATVDVDAGDGREDAPAAEAVGRLHAAALVTSHLVLVVAPRIVVVLRHPVALVDDGAGVRLEGSDGRVTWVPDDARPLGARPASLRLRSAP